MYSTKCFILFTIKYIKRAAKGQGKLGDGRADKKVKMFLKNSKLAVKYTRSTAHLTDLGLRGITQWVHEYGVYRLLLFFCFQFDFKVFVFI